MIHREREREREREGGTTKIKHNLTFVNFTFKEHDGCSPNRVFILLQ